MSSIFDYENYLHIFVQNKTMIQWSQGEARIELSRIIPGALSIG
jgi:hypothetical protein